MQRLTLTLSMILTAASAYACSSPEKGGGGDDSGGATGGSSTGGGSTGGSGATTGGASGSSMGGSATGGSDTGGSTATGGSATGGGDTGGSAGSGGSAGGFTKSGICDQRSEATVPGSSSYMGFEEFILISEEAKDDGRTDDPQPADLLCVIRFDVAHSGTAPAGCVDPEAVDCLWMQTVVYSNAQKMIDVDGACGRSEIGWDQAWIDATDGSTVSYGYIDMYSSHESVVMKYYTDMSMWDVHGRASWNDMTGAFNFTHRFGNCRY